METALAAFKPATGRTGNLVSIYLYVKIFENKLSFNMHRNILSNTTGQKEQATMDSGLEVEKKKK